VQAKRAQQAALKQAQREAQLAEHRVATARQQQAEQVELWRQQTELAQLPLAERAAAARAAPRWVPDAEARGCMICAKAFGFRWGQREVVHHCHYCGWAVCDSCSKGAMRLQQWLDPAHPHFRNIWHESAKALRVCDMCMDHRVDRIGPASKKRAETRSSKAQGKEDKAKRKADAKAEKQRQKQQQAALVAQGPSTVDGSQQQHAEQQQQQQQRMRVVVPAGVHPGMQMLVMANGNKQYAVTIPHGLSQGMEFEIMLPAAD
jgi:hypothetical protein